MTPLTIICVDDEPEVLDALLRDLAEFEDTFHIDVASSAAEARELIDGLAGQKRELALILCDHIMPGKNGVDLLIDLHEEPRHRAAQKVLVTGQAGLEDTVEAVNKANLRHFIAKPWKQADLVHNVQQVLTDYVIENARDLLPYMRVLDTERLMRATLARNPGDA